MATSVATCERNAQTRRPGVARDALFFGTFTAHARVRFFRVASDKTSPSQRVSAADMQAFEFYTPPQSVGSALIIDVDRPEAVLEIFEAVPAEIHPSWVVETRRGAQAGWMIDPVDLRDTAREHPIRYARAVGQALRRAVGGDEAVDPLTPARVRNPAYERADLRAAATPPVYTLGTLHQALKAANLWNPTASLGPSRNAAVTLATIRGGVSEGSRNVAVFDAARYIAYDGGDYETAAWDAAEQCTPPLPASEVHGIIRSINRYMTKPGRGHRGTSPMPSQMHDLLSEMGRRGGKANTPAQQAARAKNCQAATATRRRATDAKALQAQRMHARGHSHKKICAAMRASTATVCRWLRRFIPQVSFPELQVVRPHQCGPERTSDPCSAHPWNRYKRSCGGRNPGKAQPPPACQA